MKPHMRQKWMSKLEACLGDQLDGVFSPEGCIPHPAFVEQRVAIPGVGHECKVMLERFGRHLEGGGGGATRRRFVTFQQPVLGSFVRLPAKPRFPTNPTRLGPGCLTARPGWSGTRSRVARVSWLPSECAGPTFQTQNGVTHLLQTNHVRRGGRAVAEDLVLE